MFANFLARLKCSDKSSLEIYKKRNHDYLDCNFLAIDLELTSLDTETADILSMGFIPIHNGKIISAKARHILISDHGGVGHSATLHGLRDCDTEAGAPIREALLELKHALVDHIPVFHHAALDLALLSRFDPIYKRQIAIDTLKLEQKKLSRQGRRLENALRLDQCRSRYHLPRYQAHNALSDALATAELFLANITHRTINEKVKLADLL